MNGIAITGAGLRGSDVICHLVKVNMRYPEPL
jgi:hypothetical protein